jgi:hypothetical protein
MKISPGFPFIVGGQKLLLAIILQNSIASVRLEGIKEYGTISLMVQFSLVLD